MTLVSAGLIAFLINAAVQVTVVCAGTALGLIVMRSAPARDKHRIAVFGLGLSALIPIVGAWFASQATGSTAIAGTSIDANPLATDRVALTIVYGYLALTIWKVLVIAREFATALMLRRTSTPIVDGPIVESFHRYASDGRIQLRRSARSVTPLLLGWLNPIILIPDQLADGDAAVIDAVVAHECAHVARHDVPIATAIELLTMAFAFHPAIVLLKRAAAKYRELACDEEAINRLRITSNHYATALVAVAEYGVAPVAVSAAGAGSHLEERVRVLLDRRHRSAGVIMRALGYACLLCVVAVAPPCAIAIDGGWRNLSGVWTLDVDHSEPRGHVPFQSARMQIDTTGDRLLIAQQRTRANGRVETFEIRGTSNDVPFKVHLPGSAALQTRARWNGNRLITDAFGPGRRYREHGEAVADGDRLVIDTEQAFDTERAKYQLVFRRE